MEMRISTDGRVLRDEHGRERVFQGINLVEKGTKKLVGSFADRGFRGRWTPADIADFAARGFTLIRLGVMWAAVEPAPGEYDGDYLDWVRSQMDLIHEHGMAVLLDAHQDLYSQAFGDGAPAWATLSSGEFAETDLWSDAYLTSPALHEALDNFWANAPGPGGIGLQDRFAVMWAHVAGALGDHPGLLGYDLLNEPAPGSAAPQTFGYLLGAFAQVTGQDFDAVMADFTDPEAKFAQLGRLEDEAVHRQVGDAVHGLVAEFETAAVAPFMQKVRDAIREVDGGTLIAREHSYFANMGVASGQPPLEDHAWVYSPHGYDLTVDTPAISMSSNTRAGTIFARHKETQDRLGVPVIVGEFGALGLGANVTDHGRFLVELFDSYGWSWTYWCWEPGFAGSEAAVLLRRSRPVACAGSGLSWQARGSELAASWSGQDSAQPSVFYLSEPESITVTCDGAEVGYDLDGPWLRVAAGPGRFELTVR